MFKFAKPYRIALVAPSGPCAPETVDAGKKVLESGGCRVTVMPNVFSGCTLEHLAADDDARAGDINAAIDDETVDIIWAVRGGSGAGRLLNKINWQKLRKREVLFAGFSDITAIHWAMAKHGISGNLAAPMMSFLAKAADQLSIDSLPEAVEGKAKEFRLPALRKGEITGKVLPGNIAVASSLCGTPFFPETAEKILILEEIGEEPYRIDRMLTQLRLAGTFDRCAAVVFGHFTNCGDAGQRMKVLQDFTARVACPVFCGLPHGHELPFCSLSGRQTVTIRPL